eukprot:6214753-Pleurochrysis_carterae.AAC.1
MSDARTIPQFVTARTLTSLKCYCFVPIDHIHSSTRGHEVWGIGFGGRPEDDRNHYVQCFHTCRKRALLSFFWAIGTQTALARTSSSWRCRTFAHALQPISWRSTTVTQN